MRFLVVLLFLAGCQDGAHHLPTFQVGDEDAGPDPDGGAADAFVPEDPGPPLRHGDRVFHLPYQGPAQQTEMSLEAQVRQLDVHFSIDTTFSFDQEIDELQSALIDEVIPGVRANVTDATFGVSRFEDFPTFPFGAPDDRPFRLEQRQTTEDHLAGRAVGRLDDPLGDGGDLPEASLEALYQIASGEGFVLDGARIVDGFDDVAGPGGGTLGGAGFREGALPVIVQVTDAAPHVPADYRGAFSGAHSRDDALDALDLLGARVIGIASGEEARPNLVSIATATDAVVPPGSDGRCATGIGGAHRAAAPGGICPLVFDIDEDGSGLSETIVTAVTDLLSSIVFDTVSIEIVGDDLGFVVDARPLEAQAPPGAPPPGTADLVPAGGDGAIDSFTQVRPGTTLVFQITLANTAIPDSDYEQIYFLHARLVTDTHTTVDDQLIEVRIP